jgi:hypothetical protein
VRDQCFLATMGEILSTFLREAIQKRQIFRASRENKGAKNSVFWEM